MTKQESLIIELLDACIVAERAFRVPARTNLALEHAALDLLRMVIKKAQARDE
jgi:hypothetical protein